MPASSSRQWDRSRKRSASHTSVLVTVLISVDDRSFAVSQRCRTYQQYQIDAQFSPSRTVHKTSHSWHQNRLAAHHRFTSWRVEQQMLRYDNTRYADIQRVLKDCPTSRLLKRSKPRRHIVEMYASAIIGFGLVMTLTFDL